MSDPALFVGKVMEISVQRTGADGSAQLEFTLTRVKGDAESQTFVVVSNISPQAFTGMVAMLTGAYASALLVTVGYVPGEPQKAISVKLGGPPERQPGRVGFV